MTAFGGIWRGFTRGQLAQLLEEYPDRNLPHMIRRDDLGDRNAQLDRDFMFVGVTYRPKLNPAMSRLFSDSLNADNSLFAQGMLFAPRGRPTALRWVIIQGIGEWRWVFNGAPGRWDLWNEDWNFQLVPAQTEAIPTILQRQPQTNYATGAAGHRAPQLGTLGAGEWRLLTTH
jgi:hypothetical protein